MKKDIIEDVELRYELHYGPEELKDRKIRIYWSFKDAENAAREIERDKHVDIFKVTRRTYIETEKLS